MKRLRPEAIRSILRLTHKSLPRLAKYFKFLGLNLFIPYRTFNPVYTVSAAPMMRNIRPYGGIANLGCSSGVVAVYVAKNFKVEELGLDIKLCRSRRCCIQVF